MSPEVPLTPAQRAAQRVGSTVLKWRLDALLGVGGTAAVYAATHHNRSRVALKILHRELSVIPELCTRFLREAYVANSVGHEGAVQVLDDQMTESGEPVLVMQLLEGHPLDAIREARGVLPVDEALHYADQVLDVLTAAHAHGVVHRDIKPQNIFVTTQGAVKVLDFGVARMFDGTASMTQTGMLVGTPAFMPPEQASGRTAEIGPLSDLWAVGATVFTLLTGHFVHEAENAQQHTVRAAVFPARSLATLRPDLPAPLVEWVDKSLAFDLKNRFPSAQKMREALSRLRATLARSSLPGAAQNNRSAASLATGGPPGVGGSTGVGPAGHGSSMGGVGPAGHGSSMGGVGPAGHGTGVGPDNFGGGAAPGDGATIARDPAAIARAHGLPPPVPRRQLTTAEKGGIAGVAVLALLLVILVVRGLSSRGTDSGAANSQSGSGQSAPTAGLSAWLGTPHHDTPGSAPPLDDPSATPTTDPPPAGDSGAPRKFVPEEGRAALDLGEAEARRCKKLLGPKGRMSVEVTFHPDGDTTAQVEIRFARSPVGACVEEAFRAKAKVPPFTGTAVTATRMVTVPD